MVKKNISEKLFEKILDWILDKKIMEILFPSLSFYTSYITQFMKTWAPFSYVVSMFIGLVFALIFSNLILDRKLKRSRNAEKKESYIEFKYEDGMVPTKTQNSYIAHASKTGGAPILLFIIFEENLNYSSIDISPTCKWKKINFHPQYAIIELWDIKNGNYKMIFI